MLIQCPKRMFNGFFEKLKITLRFLLTITIIYYLSAPHAEKSYIVLTVLKKYLLIFY